MIYAQACICQCTYCEDKWISNSSHSALGLCSTIGVFVKGCNDFHLHSIRISKCKLNPVIDIK